MNRAGLAIRDMPLNPPTNISLTTVKSIETHPRAINESSSPSYPRSTPNPIAAAESSTARQTLSTTPLTTYGATSEWSLAISLTMNVEVPRLATSWK